MESGEYWTENDYSNKNYPKFLNLYKSLDYDKRFQFQLTNELKEHNIDIDPMVLYSKKLEFENKIEETSKSVKKIDKQSFMIEKMATKITELIEKTHEKHGNADNLDG